MPKSIHKLNDGHYETEQTSVKFRFLDCNCQCRGEKQKFFPEKTNRLNQQFYSNIFKILSKPHYSLDCTCQCGTDQKQLTGFSTNTGIRRFNLSDEGKTT